MKRPLSMTAFGRGEARDNGRIWTIEIRSVNHRYCDISVKLPRSYVSLEDRIKKQIQEYYTRGRVEITLTIAGDFADNKALEPNLSLVRQYYQCLEEIRQDLGLEGHSDLRMIAGFKDIIAPVEREEDLDQLWSFVNAALHEALQKGMQMRQAEGQSLKKDLENRLDAIRATVESIAASIPELLEQKEKSMQERLEKLLQGLELDPARLAQEIAILADKTDITEELVRLTSHLEQFTGFLEIMEPAGRRLDFLLQEFLREINTMASKISEVAVIHQIVELKNEVEKMREQVQNLE